MGPISANSRSKIVKDLRLLRTFTQQDWQKLYSALVNKRNSIGYVIDSLAST
jgi:hypothetical protein